MPIAPSSFSVRCSNGSVTVQKLTKGDKHFIQAIAYNSTGKPMFGVTTPNKGSRALGNFFNKIKKVFPENATNEVEKQFNAII